MLGAKRQTCFLVFFLKGGTKPAYLTTIYKGLPIPFPPFCLKQINAIQRTLCTIWFLFLYVSAIMIQSKRKPNQRPLKYIIQSENLRMDWLTLRTARVLVVFLQPAFLVDFLINHIPTLCFVCLDAYEVDILLFLKNTKKSIIIWCEKWKIINKGRQNRGVKDRETNQ